MREIAKLAISVKRRKGGLVESPTGIAPKTQKGDLPSYGAQHLQDALWEGGNEALPPGWHQFEVGHRTYYQDDDLYLVSSRRPLPGAKLDYPGYLLVPGCEWHISPLGRSYFVNHNNQTTSWRIPIPERPPGSLSPEHFIEDHSEGIWSFACVGTSRGIISGSLDGSIRHWTRNGRIIGQPWRTNGGEIMSIAVSPDETMATSGSADGRIRLWSINEGKMVGEPWEGHNSAVRCIDWSPNGQEIASGSPDGTVRRWNLIGRQIAPSIEVGQGWVETVKYSSKGDRFAACGVDNMIYVWSKDGKLLTKIGESDSFDIMSLRWSTDGTCIFSGSEDGTIRKWRLIDGEELIVLRGHTDRVSSLYLSIDECYLLSASFDSSVRIWDLGTNKPVGEPLWHDDRVWTVAMTPDRQYIASHGLDMRIYMWNFKAALEQSSNQGPHDSNVQSDAGLKECIVSPGDILDISTKSQLRLNHTTMSKYGDNFWKRESLPSPHVHAPLTSVSRRRKLFDFMRFNLRSVDSSTHMPRQRRRWNVSLSSKRVSSHTADRVAAARDDDRYYVSPPTDAEVTAAMKDESGIASNDSAHQDGSAPGVQGPQHHTPAQMAQGSNLVTDTDEQSDSFEIRCCGIYLVLGRGRPH